ncbi:MAG: hypothetical protein ABL925_11010 [Methylococcales bacterium]
MSETAKIVAAIVAVFVMGFVLVGANKEVSKEESEASANIRNYVAIQTMANQKCPEAIKKETGEQVFFPSGTESDKESYITLKWVGDKDNKFKTASCTLKASLGGISELVIDDKVIIKK